MGAYRLLGKPMEGGAQVRRLVGISRKLTRIMIRRLVRLRKTRLFDELRFRQCANILKRSTSTSSDEPCAIDE